MVLSLTTHKGVQDFAFNKEQALLIAKTMKETAAGLAEPKQVEARHGPARSGAGRRDAQERDSEMVAPLNWLSARITTDCLLPRVVNEMLALNPARAGDAPGYCRCLPRPWRLPLMPRLLSLQVPEISPPSATTLVLQIEFVAVAGAGQGLIEAGPAGADGIGRAAANSLGRAVVERDGAAARPVARRGRRTAPIARSLRSRTTRRPRTR